MTNLTRLPTLANPRFSLLNLFAKWRKRELSTHNMIAHMVLF